MSVTAIAQPPTIQGCPVLPADNIWNAPIDQLPVLPSSATWVGTIGTSKPLHPNFGADSWNGIPYILVPGSQIKLPVTFYYADQSDAGPYAIPLTAPIEGGSTSTDDRHTISIDTDNCILYELYDAYPQAASWTAGSGAIFNLNSDALRPAGWTSTDAAGLPILPGLVRYDEVAAGAINHALRFTVPQTQNTYVWPARHFASTLTGSQYPPMGARFRLRADFDISGYSAANQVILTALKKYGMMIADNGSSWYITGTPDARWSDSDLHGLTQITGSEFEAVDVSGLIVDPNSGQARQAAAVTVTVSPATASVKVGVTQQFTATVANSSSQGVTWSVNGVTGGNTTVGQITSSGVYTAPATVPAGGSVVIKATSTATTSASGSATVTITAAPVTPVLSSITPASGTQGTSVPVTLTGSGFQLSATVYVGGAGVTVSGSNVLSATQITAVLTIAASAGAGAHNVTVSTSAGTSSAQTFTVDPPLVSRPTLASLTPNAVRRGSSVQATLTGTGFTNGASVQLPGSIGVTVSNVTVVNSTTLTATFTAAQHTGTGARAVVVVTPAGSSNALTLTVQ